MKVYGSLESGLIKSVINSFTYFFSFVFRATDQSEV